MRELVDAGQGVGMILPIAGITIQKFLRKIRIVMMSILICGLW
nr:L371 [uncultured bacterium]